MGLLGKLIRFITGQTRSGRISPKVELNNLPALKTFILEPIITPSGVVDSSHFSEPLFESGFFTVGAKGEVGVDYLFDGGGYEGELAIFSLKDLEQYDVSTSQGLHDFIQVVAERALSDSELGHIVISDAAEGARFSGIFPSEWHDWNAGEYQGVKTFNMHPGDTFGVMLVPNATVQELYDNPDAGGAVRPLFSMVTANPSEAFHLGQAVDVNGKATTFVLEDQRFDQGSDHDYEDIIFQFHGATGKAANMDNFVNHDVDWRGSELGQKLMEFIKPPANQPLIGIIDTGITADNPDLDPYHIHFGNHADLVAGDGNPLLQPGEGSEHGTHIAGIIAGTQNNGLGIDGINDQAPLYISRATGSGNWAQGLVDFVDAAKESGQPHAIANLSLDLTQINHDGSVTTRYEFTPFEREALEYARQNHVLIVAAAGNDGDVMSVLGQASQEFDNIITVGAAKHIDLTDPSISIDTSDNSEFSVNDFLGHAPLDYAVDSTLDPSVVATEFDRAEYSSYGYGLDIVADGGTLDDPVLSTVGDDLGTMAGTSVATAQVTGAASLIWAENPDLSYRQVIDILKSTSIDLNAPGWDEETGSGLLNIAAALELARITTGQDYNPETFYIPTTWDGQGKVTPTERAADDSPSSDDDNFDGAYDIGTIQSDSRRHIVQDYVGDGNDQQYSDLQDYYKFSLSNRSDVNVFLENVVNGDTSPSLTSNIEVELYNASYQLLESGYYHSGNSESIKKTLEAGNYYIKVYQGSNGTYYNVGVQASPHTNSSGTLPDDEEDPDQNLPPNSITINGYTVDGNFYPVYTNYRGTLGNPKSGVQYNSKTGASFQLFDNGSIVSSQYGTFPIYGGIRQTYLNRGGLEGFLGVPLSGEIGLGNGVIAQKFVGGYIYWNGRTATAYQYGKGLKKDLTPINVQPTQVTLTGGKPGKSVRRVVVSKRKTSKKTIPYPQPQELPAPHDFDIKPNFDKSFTDQELYEGNYDERKAILDAIHEWESIIKRGPKDEPKESKIERGFSVKISYSSYKDNVTYANSFFNLYDQTGILTIYPGFFNQSYGIQKKTILHELAHAMGFGQSSSVRFSRNLKKDDHGKFFYDAPNAIATYGGRIPLQGNFNAATEEPYSHFDEKDSKLKLDLMSAKTEENYNAKDMIYTLAVLKDMGFEIND